MITIVREKVAPPPIEKVIMELTPKQAAFIKWLAEAYCSAAANSLYEALRDVTAPVDYTVRFNCG